MFYCKWWVWNRHLKKNVIQTFDKNVPNRSALLSNFPNDQVNGVISEYRELFTVRTVWNMEQDNLVLKLIEQIQLWKAQKCVPYFHVKHIKETKRNEANSLESH